MTTLDTSPVRSARPPAMHRMITLTSSEMLRQRDYWRNELAGIGAMPSFAEVFEGSVVLDDRASREQATLPREVVAALARGVGSTEAELGLACIALLGVLLHQCFGRQDILVGALAGRSQRDQDSVNVSNVVPLRLRVAASTSFRELVTEARRAVLRANENAAWPYELQFADVGAGDGDPARFVRVLAAFERDNLSSPDSGVSRGDVRFDFRCTRDDLRLRVQARHLDAASVEHLVVGFVSLAEQAASDLGRPAGEFRLPSITRRAPRVIGVQPAGPLRLAHEEFSRHALLRPDAEAVVSDDHRMTFAELEGTSNRLAHELRDRGAGRGDVVALYCDRSPLAVAGVLAAFKSGAAYVPLDRSQPDERRRFMLRDSDAQVVLTTAFLAAEARRCFHLPVLVMDDLEEDSWPDAPPGVHQSPHDLAYIVYTSGTTGRPKGVAIEHGSYTRLCANYVAAYGLTTFEPVALQIAALTFDVFNGDLARSVLNGFKLVICPDEARTEYGRLWELIEAERVSLVESTPVLINELVRWMRASNRQFSTVRVLISGGDAWNMADYRAVRSYLDRRVTIFNSYGPAEVTVDATYLANPAVAANTPIVPIGRPFSDTDIRVAGSHSEVPAEDSVGELLIGGPGLARGYLGRPALTAEHFVPDPLGPPGSRLYRTGDLARRLPDGTFEFVGRIDHQVKIRGARVELGEVEAVLREHEHVRSAVVVARHPHGDARLVAYLVCNGAKPPTTSDLRRHLGQRLPDFMVPSAFVFLAQLPVNANGKIDRAALPEPEGERPDLDAGYSAPRNQAERRLAALWSESLNLDRVGVDDNFFELGGHSLLATRLLARIREVFELQLPLRTFFEHPTIAGLAAELTGSDTCA